MTAWAVPRSNYYLSFSLLSSLQLTQASALGWGWRGACNQLSRLPWA